MINIESRRAWYLAALGVVRYALKDGPVSLADAPAQEEQAAPERQSDQRTLAAADRADSMAAVRQALVDKTPEPAVPPPAVPAAAPAAEEVLAFRLAFWQPAPQVVVLSAMPPGVRVSASQQDMLANLLRAIHSLPGGGLAAAELIDWPPRVGAPAGLDGARQLLDVFLEVKAKLQPFTTALLMGEIPARLIAGRGAQPGERLTLHTGAEGIVTHSLHDMEKAPALKRETWEAIRHLAGGGNG
ncbi:MAG: hypothetical protein WC997_05840 [Porticoccaceae bacterium]